MRRLASRQVHGWLDFDFDDADDADDAAAEIDDPTIRLYKEIPTVLSSLFKLLVGAKSLSPFLVIDIPVSAATRTCE